MAGTDSFHELDEEVKLCQDRETLEDCLAEHFLKKGREKCKCIPFRLRNYTKEVKLELLFSLKYKTFRKSCAILLAPNVTIMSRKMWQNASLLARVSMLMWIKK